jgi:23S rRNA (guanosine2251-2'-O)-methyltransferase
MKHDLIFGLHAVQAVLARSPERIYEIHLLEGRQDARLQPLIDQCKQLGIRCSEKPRKTLDNLATGQSHQGVVALAKMAKAASESDLTALLDQLDADGKTPFLLILDGVTDPHNLGACLRSADAAGVQAVIAPKDKAVGLTEVARKVACGAAETVPFIAVTNLARCLETLKNRGIWLLGTAGEATQSLYHSNLTGPLAVVMGAEGSGMRRLTREACDYLAYLPMAGSVSSLNVSVATGITLFEAVRQRSATA